MKRVMTVWCAAGLLVVFALGQGHPVAQTPDATVELDVLVTDKDGKPITDLRQDEFQIEDDGKKVDVKSMTPVSVLDGRSVVVLLDDSGVPMAGTQAIQNIADIFMSAAAPGDKVSLRRLHTDADVMDFNRQTAAARIMSYRAGVVPFVQSETADEVVILAKAIADQLIEPDHVRKAIVCIGAPSVCNVEAPSSSAPRQVYPNWVKAIDSAARSNVAFYSMVPAKMNILKGTIIDATGGETFTSSTDFGEASKNILQDLSQYYLLNYSPAASTKDLRKIYVKTTRKGATIRTRLFRGR